MSKSRPERSGDGSSPETLWLTVLEASCEFPRTISGIFLIVIAMTRNDAYREKLQDISHIGNIGNTLIVKKSHLC